MAINKITNLLRSVSGLCRRPRPINHHIRLDELDEHFYSTRYPEYRFSGLSVREHYQTYGKARSLFPNAVAEIAPLFDEEFYLSRYPDIANAEIPAINHFFFFGAREGRQPNPLFNPNWYIVKHPEVVDGGLNPLVHWTRYGWRMGYNPSAWFDTSYYLAKGPDIQRARIDPLWHFLLCGCYENRPCHPDINPIWYLSTYPDTKEFARGATLHFLLHGAAEGRSPNPDFDGNYYGLCMSGKMGEGQTPQHHWVQWGIDGEQHYAPPRRAGDSLPAPKKPLQSGPEPKVAVIVPVYRGLEETRRCIETVLSNCCTMPFKLVIINDASPEAELTQYVNSLAGDARLTVLTNQINLGFVGTVNRGMSMFPDHDVVLLNSDTEVPERWVDRLVAHAYASPYVGSVTPLSNNATICSYPTFAGSRSMHQDETLESMDRACETANAGMSAIIPTGVGFCMYIRRQCLDEIGLFDQEAFGKGYGEENDFCMRAMARGWKHLLALDTYVFHNGEISFGTDSLPGKLRAMEILRERYPDYDTLIARHIAEDPGWPRRLAITAQRYRSSDVPVILTITHGLGGGTEKHVVHLRNYLGKRVRFLEMRPCSAETWSAKDDRRVRLTSGNPDDYVDIRVDASSDFENMVNLLKSFGVRRLHIHHMLFLDVDIERLIRALDVPFDFTVHDYFTICPQVHLLTAEGAYCGEPDVPACNECIEKRSAHGARDIMSWRGQMGWLIENADRVLCPSGDVATRIRRYHPSVPNLRTVPHSHLGEAPVAEAWAPPLNEDEPLRVAVLGVMARHKGGEKVLACAASARAKKQPIHFTVIGYLDGDLEGQGDGQIAETGRYNDDELAGLIAKVDPHVIWFPALWPETYSYTLSAALASGRPIVAVSIGAIVERLEGRSWCWQVPWNTKPAEANAFFVDIADRYFRKGKPPPIQDGNPPAIAASFYDNEYLAPLTPKEQTPNHLIDLRRPGVFTLATLLQTVSLHTPGTVKRNPDPCGYIRGLLPMCTIGDNLATHMVDADSANSVITDALFVQRTAIPFQESAETLLSHCRRHGIRIVYDIDDNLFAIPPSHCDYAAYEDKLKAAFVVLKAADLVTVSTEVLRRQLADYNPNTLLVPNALSSTVWNLDTPPRIATAKPSRSKQPVRLLYMGTATHQVDFEMVRPALARLKDEFGDKLRIEVVGIAQESYVDDLFTRIPVPPTITESYPLFASWLRGHGPWDIGIAPLVDEFFNRNKSDIKVLDYTAIGAAVACSNLCPYNVWVRDGVDGLLIGYDVDEWHQKLRSLIVDPDLRLRLWRASWGRMLAERTLEIQRPLYQQVLARLGPVRDTATGCESIFA